MDSSHLKQLDICLTYIGKVREKGFVSDEFYCDYMLKLALDYREAGSRNDAHFVLKSIGKDLLEKHLEASLKKDALMISDLEELVLYLNGDKTEKKEEAYVFSGPKGQA